MNGQLFKNPMQAKMAKNRFVVEGKCLGLKDIEIATPL